MIIYQINKVILNLKLLLFSIWFVRRVFDRRVDRRGDHNIGDYLAKVSSNIFNRKYLLYTFSHCQDPQ